MEGLVLVTDIEGCRYEIVGDSNEDYVVYRYYGQGPRLTDHHIHQDNIDAAICAAETTFRVPRESWREPKPEEAPAFLTKQEPLTKSQARRLVEMELCFTKTESFGILEERTLAYHWGWTFFVDSKKYVETKDSRYSSPNRAAFMVIKQTAELIKSPFSRLRIYYQFRYRGHRQKQRRHLPIDELKALMRKEWGLPEE
jgi:hypothetical protein